MFTTWRRNRTKENITGPSKSPKKSSKRTQVTKTNNVPSPREREQKKEKQESDIKPEDQKIKNILTETETQAIQPPKNESNSSSSSSKNQSTELIQEEYERKIRVLSQCLSEKAEENITLHEKLHKHDKKIENLIQEIESSKDLELLVSELNSMLRDKNMEFEALKADSKLKDKERLELQQLSQELQRRIRVLSTCLEEMAQENLGYYNESSPSESSSKPQDLSSDNRQKPVLQAQPTISVEAKLAELSQKQEQERNDEERKALESELANVREELHNSEERLHKKEKIIVQLNTKLMDAVNKKNALSESNDLYEEKLKSLEKEFTDNLQQEGKKRQAAQEEVARLEKKLAELRFLLDERDNSDSSISDDFSEEDYED